MMVNRILWGVVGLCILFGTWLRFSFARFFGGKGFKTKNESSVNQEVDIDKVPAAISVDSTSKYNYKAILSLVKIELASIFRDNYFRLILLAGICSLAYIFWRGPAIYNVPDFPRTVRFLGTYDHDFQFFAFIVIIFYTGEALQREKASRFAAINDSLPPADWVFYGSKLLALIFLPFVLATIPMLTGIGVQLAKGYVYFNLPVYFSYCFGLLLPKYLEMLMLSVAIHVLVNNKFAAHAVGIIIWWLLWLANNGAVIDYNLILYSYTPSYRFSDMDDIGPATKPLSWFNVYWLFNGALLLVLGALFYPRGIMHSGRERIRLAMHRFQPKLIVLTVFLLAGFLVTGVYNYYQVSYRGTYLLRAEGIERLVDFERQLKRYKSDPLPTIVSLKLFADIFPEERSTSTTADFSIINKTVLPIRRILLDGDQFSHYSVKYNGKEMPFTCALIYPRATLSFFKPKKDTSMYRVYKLPQPLAPGDSAVIELVSAKEITGFSNRFSSMDVLYNGTFFDGGLPGLGYDDEEELSIDDLRLQYGLPKKEAAFPPQGDWEGRSKLLFTAMPGLVKFEATISTSADQVAITSGTLEKAWSENGRNYFHYVLDSPKSYFLFPVLSARYSILRDSVKLFNGNKVGIDIYYHPSHATNLVRFLGGCRDGLNYYSKAFGDYQFKQLRLLETSMFTQQMSAFPGCISFAEYFGWNASFTDPNQFDYCYFYTAFQLARQWWMLQVAPNHAEGAYDISEGLSKYGALMVYEKKVGKDNIGGFLHSESGYYLDRHKYAFETENPLANSRNDYVWNNKAGLILYGLRDLMGEDSLNTALREFRDAYAFRNAPPYAGSDDLYRYIKKHVPDSLQYYLTDCWEKITLYDNKVMEASYSPIGNGGLYKVHIKVSCGKFYSDSVGKEKPATHMNDYIDIGIFGAATQNNDRRMQANPLYFKKYKLTGGEHSFDVVVKERPTIAGIDPYGKLIDRSPGDNMKDL